jgi:hypothetical protein
VRGRRAKLSFAPKHARPRIRCSRLLGAQQPDPALRQNNALKVVAPPGREAGAHRRGAPPSLVVQQLARDSRAARAPAGARRDLVRGGEFMPRMCRPGSSRTGVCRRAECAAQKPNPAAPNDTRVRGAGPPRKTFLRPKVCKAPHPLQPIVRPPARVRVYCSAEATQVVRWRKPARHSVAARALLGAFGTSSIPAAL